jgi:hypothetical protein
LAEEATRGDLFMSGVNNSTSIVGALAEEATRGDVHVWRE